MTVDHMKELPNDRQIYISSRLWHEIHPKVDLTPFIFTLHEGIDLSKYGEGIRKFYFTFIIVKPNDIINRPYAHFNKKKREVDIAIKISYTKAEKASSSKLIRLMEDAFLQGIEKLKTLPLNAPFDVDQLQKDVKRIFSREGWFKRGTAA